MRGEPDACKSGGRDGACGGDSCLLKPTSHSIASLPSILPAATLPCQVDIRVDVEALRQLVAGRLVAIRSGASVAEAALPWPRLPDPPPASAKAQAPAGQRLVARLLDSGAPEQLPDVAAVWAHLRRP